MFNSNSVLRLPGLGATAAKPVLISNPADIVRAAHCLKAMGQSLRLEILCIVGAAAEVSVQDIVERVGTSESNISQHLSILRETGILASRKQANKVYCRIADPKIVQLIGTLRDAFCRPAEGLAVRSAPSAIPDPGGLSASSTSATSA